MRALVVQGGDGSIHLGRLIAKGGEGTVYEVQGRPDFVAKIYHKDISQDRIDKLLAMQTLLTPALAALTAWPSDVLRGTQGKVVGFLMPNVKDAQDIHALYGPKSRLSTFPHADWRMLVRVALNTAKAFAVLHDAGCLGADVNHGGIRVARDSTVKLIDCDSFQVTHGARTFLCEVGVENFTPPELQGVSFRDVTRTTNHDNFGLAVMIFHLLMVGRHPFAGRFTGPEDMPVHRAIPEFRYAYGKDRMRTKMQPPPLAPVSSIAGEEIAQMWEAAFDPQGIIENSRPSAAQWVYALTRIEDEFQCCARHAGHYFLKSVASCPWCPIEAIGVVLFLLPITHDPIQDEAFDIEVVWARIIAVPCPEKVPDPAATLPSVVSHAGLKCNLFCCLYFLIVIFAGTFALMEIRPSSFAGMFGTVFAIIIVVGILFSLLWPMDYLEQFEQANLVFRPLSDRWTREATTESYNKKFGEMQTLRNEWMALPDLRRKRHDELIKNREIDALHTFLDSFEIETATDTGIGSSEKTLLASYGIETAADINPQALLQVPMLGSAITKCLMDWRAKKELGFNFNPHSGADPRRVAEMDRDIQQRKREIEQKLLKGAGELKHIRTTILARRLDLEEPLRQAAIAYAQAKLDLEQYEKAMKR